MAVNKLIKEAGRKGSTLTIFFCCCFTANFGPWSLGPQHGFARTSQWTVSQQPKVWTFFLCHSSESTKKKKERKRE